MLKENQTNIPYAHTNIFYMNLSPVYKKQNFKFLWENIVENLCDFMVEKDFLNKKQKAPTRKEMGNKFNYR